MQRTCFLLVPYLYCVQQAMLHTYACHGYRSLNAITARGWCQNVSTLWVVKLDSCTNINILLHTFEGGVKTRLTSFSVSDQQLIDDYLISGRQFTIQCIVGRAICICTCSEMVAYFLCDHPYFMSAKGFVWWVNKRLGSENCQSSCISVPYLLL